MFPAIIKKVYYKILDVVHLNKGVPRTVNGTALRFPANWSRYYGNEYEADNYHFVESNLKEGMHLIDIGAHIGLFSVIVSKQVGKSGKVVCLEPTPGTFQILSKTLRLNHCANVKPLQAAAGEKPGKATFYVDNNVEGANSNSLVLNRSKDRVKGYEVEVKSIDQICTEEALRPSLIKIDAEGAELDVLKGGLNTFKIIRPLIILGLHPNFISNKGDSLQEIWDLIESCNYRVIFEGKQLNALQFVSQNDLFDVQLLPVS